jgi:hypothetical protein
MPIRRLVGAGDSLVSLAGEHFVSWEELALYNWGTQVPREINWYLHRDCRTYTAATKSGHNLMFVGKKPPAPLHHARSFLWVPGLMPVDEPTGIIIPRTRAVVIDSADCPNLIKGSRKCAVVETPRGTPAPCQPPSEKSEPVVVQLGKSADARARKSVETQVVQSARVVMLRWNVVRIVRAPGQPPREEVPFERVTELSIDFEASSSRTVADAAGAPPPAGLGPLASYPELPAHALVEQGKAELDAVAQHIRALRDADVLARLVIRGYTDEPWPLSPAQQEAFTLERARWVFRTLRDYYGIPLSDESDAGAGSVHAERKAQETALGYTPTSIVGCGVGDAPRGVPREAHRVVIVDFETRAPGPPKERSAEVSTQRRWIHYEGARGGERWSALYAEGGSHEGDCHDAVQVASCQDEAAAYVHLLCGVEEGASSKRLDPLLEEIAGWAQGAAEGCAAFFGGALAAASPGGPPPRLSRAYLVDDPYLRSLKDPVSEEPFVAGACPAFYSLDPAMTQPNHRRSFGALTSVTVDADKLRKAVTSPAGPYVVAARRIHFQSGASEEDEEPLPPAEPAPLRHGDPKKLTGG